MMADSARIDKTETGDKNNGDNAPMELISKEQIRNFIKGQM